MPITIERILCPVDFTAFSRQALEHAAAVATWYDAQVEVLHVRPDDPQIDLAGGFPSPAQPGQARLEEFVRPLRMAGIRAETRIEVGDPVWSICRRLEEWRADLVVMATHGGGGFDPVLLGAISERVLRTARCPVLLVPPGAQEVTGTPPLFARTILCPIDFSDASVAALEYALALARESDGQVTLFHVIEGLEEDWPGAQASEAQAHDAAIAACRDDRASRARQRLGTLIPADADDWCRPGAQIAFGKPYREILRVAADTGADLIVMGVVGREADHLRRFGSMTHHVAQESTCPVLTIRPAGRAAEGSAA